MLDISRQWVAESMKRAAAHAGIDPARAHPFFTRHLPARGSSPFGPVLRDLDSPKCLR